MKEEEVLLARNVVNGIAPEALAQTQQVTVAVVMQAFSDVMRLVAEYRLVHCVPFFPCTAVADARRHRQRVFEVLEAIALWDEIERDMMLDLLKGVNVMKKYGAAREIVEALLNRTLNAVPHYLTAREAAEFGRDRKGFVTAHRARVIEAVERFVSFRNPLVYKRIEDQCITLEAA